MEPKITNLKQKDDTISFNLIGAHQSLANALRRVILAEIPNVAISEVNFENNNTPYTDEFLAERLRLIPVEPKIKEGTELKLSAEGKTFTPIYIWSKDINPPNSVYPEALIVPLRVGESLKLTARTEIGIAHKHAKFAMANVVAFKEEEKNKNYWLSIESRYPPFYPPKEILKKGIQVLVDKLAFIEKRLNQKDSYKVEVQQNPVSEITDFIIYEETHTLGNLLSSYLYLKYYPKEIEYISYNVPHPLEEKMVIQLRAGGPEKSRKYLSNVITELIQALSKIKV